MGVTYVIRDSWDTQAEAIYATEVSEVASALDARGIANPREVADEIWQSYDPAPWAFPEVITTDGEHIFTISKAEEE